MLILTLRTDKLESEIGLYDDQKKLIYYKWIAHRQLAETLHHKIEENLQHVGKEWGDIAGVVVYKGPGSYTGLRIGISVANALSGSLNIPIVGSVEEKWLQTGMDNLLDGRSDELVIPEYGAEAFTTLPKK
jgi:tRNA threonylcarbamoyladenosine biosynthesis protein TsaB